jgi:hypothetical protein
MKGRTIRTTGLALAMILVLVAAATPALAADPEPVVAYPGSGVDNWQPIASDPIEFVLAYSGNDEGAEIKVAANPPGSVGFNVFTDQQWLWMGAGESPMTPIGRGTINSHANDNLTWTIRTPRAWTYHIQIFPTTAAPASYWITQAGSGDSILYAVTPLSIGQGVK